MTKRGLPAIEHNLFLPALAGFFVTGVWLATKVSTGLWPLWFLLIAALLVIPLRALRLPLRLVCLPIALMLALLWTQVWLHPTMPEEGKYDAITATVYGDSKINSSGNVTFRITDVTLDGETQNGKAYAYIYTADEDDPIQLLDGQQIRFSGKVYHPYPQDNEYDFDFKMWMLQNGLHFGITSIQDVEVLSSQTKWTDYAQRIASACYVKLQAVMGEQADLAVAMLLGYSDTLAEDDYTAFQRAGVAHIMAVSGLHVGILSMAVIWLLNRLRMRKKWQVPVIAVFLLLYCGITGFAVSSLRAAVMVLLWAIAGAFGRKANPITVVSTAVLIVLVINPLQLFSAGFVLSFSAIAGIVLLYPRLMQGLDRIWKPVKVNRKRWLWYRFQYFLARLKQAAAVAIAAQIGVLLPIAAYFHAFYPYGVVFNLLIVPIVGILVPLFALISLLLWMPWVGVWIGAVLGPVAAFGVKLLLGLVRLSASLPLAEVRMAQPDIWICVGLLSIVLIISHFVRASLRRRIIAIAAIVVVAVTGSILSSPPSLRYHQLSVGWSDAALIVDGDTTIGIDTGDTGSEMRSRLLAENRDLDVLILTHLHTDHAGGLEALLDEGIAIGHVYLPVDYQLHGYGEAILAVVQRLTDEDIPVTTLKAGDTLRFHETTIDVLWPEEGYTREGLDPNDRSLAMLITMGDVRILSMADNGILYENYMAVSADILKVGHHGSKDSTGETFLQTVQPSLAVISVRSEYLPASSLLERLDVYDIQAMSTDQTGEITMIPVDGGYRAYRYIAEDDD